MELVKQLRARGDEVIATVRDADKGGGLREMGARVEIVDVAEPAAIEAMGERLRGQAIDVLVNNAGIGRFGGGVKDLNAEELHRFFAVNAIGPMLVVKALLENLRAGSTKKNREHHEHDGIDRRQPERRRRTAIARARRRSTCSTRASPSS